MLLGTLEWGGGGGGGEKGRSAVRGVDGEREPAEVGDRLFFPFETP